jgi:hypothetical protein
MEGIREGTRKKLNVKWYRSSALGKVGTQGDQKVFVHLMITVKK